ncbi:MAG: tetratricopeptide repeat protein [Myxococcales bacterium]
MDEREKKYLEMIEAFPESPLGYFTLGRYYVEQGRFREAIAPLERCIAEEQDWAAALVALADAHAGAGDKAKAIELLERASSTPQAGHGGIADDIADRLDDLRD